MRAVCDYTDFFVLATGGNTRQTKAISDEVHVVMKRTTGSCRAPSQASARRPGSWRTTPTSVLHVFTQETREYYRLEDLLERRAEARGRRQRLSRFRDDACREHLQSMVPGP